MSRKLTNVSKRNNNNEKSNKSLNEIYIYNKKFKHLNGSSTNGQNTNGQNTNGQNTNGQNTNEQNTNGQNTNGQNTNGQNTNGQNTNGQNTNGKNTNGKTSNGTNRTKGTTNSTCKKKNTIFFSAQNEIEEEKKKKKKGILILHTNTECKAILKKKKINDAKFVENVDAEIANVNNCSSCVIKNNFYQNKKKILRITPEYCDTKKKIAHHVKNKNTLHANKCVNEDILFNNNISSAFKININSDSGSSVHGNSVNVSNVSGSTISGSTISGSIISSSNVNGNTISKRNITNSKGEKRKHPLIIWSSDEKEGVKKKYSTNHNTNSIINYNDRTLKIFCNLSEDNSKNITCASGYISNDRISNIYNGAVNSARNSVHNDNVLGTNSKDSNRKKKNSQNDVQNQLFIPNNDLKKIKNYTMERTNKNKLSVTSSPNKKVIENINEYPITSKNIYDSIYIPQINIKNLINSDQINNIGVPSPTHACNNNSNGLNNVLRKSESSNLINALNAYSNVKVAVRIKPITESEENIVSIFNKNYVLIEKENEKECYLLSQKKKQATYVFDVVFDVNATQEEVFFDTAKPLIPHVFKGINCTVFAYGATGSGKTYTMLDDKNHNGIVQLSLLELFTIIKEKKCRNIKIVMSFLEVYNETIRDLLAKEKNKTLDVQEDVAEVKVSNLCEMEIQSYEQAMFLINEGVKNRKMSPTRANKVSSRSHAILQIYVFNEILDSNMNTINYKAKLCFVDLAGSERASATSNKGERFKEGSYINQSLLALANCINSLASNRNISKVRVKYRDSKLTHLLKNSLEGNCLVVMIANINPSRKSFQESNNTLKYAFRARNIKLCATVQTNDNKESDIEKILKKNNILQKEYDIVLAKYNNIKDFYSPLKVLFQLYKLVHSCYKRMQSASENFSILELKQDISIYEQLIKVKSDAIRKRMDLLNCGADEKHFIDIFDSFEDKNLDYFIHSDKNGGNDSNIDCNDSNICCNDSNICCNDSNIGCNDSNIGCNDSNIGCNDSNICGNDSNICGNDSNIGGNDSNIGGNDSNIGGNDSNIGGNDNNIGGNDNNIGGNDNNIGCNDNNDSYNNNNNGYDDNSTGYGNNNNGYTDNSKGYNNNSTSYDNNNNGYGNNSTGKNIGFSVLNGEGVENRTVLEEKLLKKKDLQFCDNSTTLRSDYIFFKNDMSKIKLDDDLSSDELSVYDVKNVDALVNCSIKGKRGQLINVFESKKNVRINGNDTSHYGVVRQGHTGNSAKNGHMDLGAIQYDDYTTNTNKHNALKDVYILKNERNNINVNFDISKSNHIVNFLKEPLIDDITSENNYMSLIKEQNGKMKIHTNENMPIKLNRNEKKEQLQTLHNNLTDMQNSILFNTINKQIGESPHSPIIKKNVKELLLHNNLNKKSFLLNGKISKNMTTEQVNSDLIGNYNISADGNKNLYGSDNNEINDNSGNNDNNNKSGNNDNNNNSENNVRGNDSVSEEDLTSGTPAGEETNILKESNTWKGTIEHFHDAYEGGNINVKVFNKEKNSAITNIEWDKLMIKNNYDDRTIDNNDEIRERNKRKFVILGENIKHEHEHTNERSMSVKKKKLSIKSKK
ncbi:kinesin-8, putative [Plasmodium malariae]|uniref:Kinesin-8, putative n=1 Tax=Plasmodium malariae TaxID=5858 RepID=A0A1A8VVZ0_PLAMA|nr:kinesin-8, putative [Plasmodium malariae]